MEAIFEFKIEEGPGPTQMLSRLGNNQDFRSYLWQHRNQQMIMTLSPAVKIAEKERMYAFYHKVVLGCAIEAFTAAGWELMDKVKADYMLKSECARGILFNKLTGQEEVYLEDKAAMTKDRLHKYISDCIHLLEAEFGMKIPDSETFLSESGFKSVRR